MKTTTPAVTEGASAASNLLEEIETGFLPEDPEYRRTGKMPADTEDASAATKKDEDETDEKDDDEVDDKLADTEDASAASAKDADTSAASAAATTQKEKGPAQTKTPATTETRWQKITRENKELREKNARLEGRAEGTQTVRETQRDTQQANAQTATEQKTAAPPARPQIDDVDPKTGKAKYSTFAEYETAKDEWLAADVLRKFQENTQSTQRQQQQSQAERAIAENLGKKFEAARAKHKDFDEVALNPNLVMPKGSVTDMFLQDSEHAGEVAYHLGQHPEILQGFYGDHDPKTGRFSNKITPQQQFRKLLAIESEVSGTKTTSAKPVTQAGKPPHQTSGTGSVVKDAVDLALEEDDSDTYMAEANSRDPRLQAVKASRKKG